MGKLKDRFLDADSVSGGGITALVIICVLWIIALCIYSKFNSSREADIAERIAEAAATSTTTSMTTTTTTAASTTDADDQDTSETSSSSTESEQTTKTDAQEEKFTTLTVGSKGDDVKKMQQRLVELGWLSGGTDGSFGPGTQKAVKAFQAAAGLAQSGDVDKATYDAMMDDDAPEDKSSESTTASTKKTTKKTTTTTKKTTTTTKKTTTTTKETTKATTKKTTKKTTTTKETTKSTTEAHTEPPAETSAE